MIATKNRQHSQMIEAPSKVQRPAMTRVLEKATYKVDQKKVATGKQQSLV